jgi:hypothetical protein
LARPAQAFDGWDRRLFLWFSLRAALWLLLVVPLGACGTRGFSLEDAVPDTSIVTSSIPPQPGQHAEDAATRSDEATIRNAVSSAIVEEVAEGGIGWANAETGSRGAIRDISETRSDGFLCRSFTATRESFSGVALYRGETCLGTARLWVMRAFDKVQ